MDTFNIQSIGRIASTLDAEQATTAAQKDQEATSFGQWLDRSIQSVSDAQNEADEAAMQLVTGQNKDIHGTMIKMQKSEIAMNLLIEVRNKVISAYEEIKRMQF